MSYAPLTVEFDKRGNATIRMKSRGGMLEMYLPIEHQGTTPRLTIESVLESLNDGVTYLDQNDQLATVKKGGERVH